MHARKDNAVVGRGDVGIGKAGLRRCQPCFGCFQRRCSGSNVFAAEPGLLQMERLLRVFKTGPGLLLRRQGIIVILFRK